MSQLARDDLFAAIRLDEGEDFYPELKRLLVEAQITTAVLISATGMLKDAELGWFDGEKYEIRPCHEPQEILALTGTVNLKDDGNIFIHVHGSLGDREHRAFGGHLIRGRVCQTCELVFALPSGISFHRRRLDPEAPPRFIPQPRERGLS
jgi:predicted DNA-binding protein with PD1-like motif